MRSSFHQWLPKDAADKILLTARLITVGTIIAVIWQTHFFQIPGVGQELSGKTAAPAGNDTPHPTEPLTLLVPKIRVAAPIILSKSDATLSDDLTRGIAHLSKTALAGEPGNAVFAGHSANVPWAKGDYNFILKDLNDLAIGDQIIIIDRQAEEKTYVYQVTEKRIVAPDDPWIFQDSKDSLLTLATCFPVGTTLSRLVVRATLSDERLASK